MSFRLFIVGLASILGQIVLLRELAVSFYGIELIYILGIGGWLLGTGVGALFFSQSFKPKPIDISVLLLLFSILLLLDVGVVRGMRQLFGGVSGAYLSFPLQLAGLALALFPIGLVSGLLFQWSAKSYLSNSRTIAGAYAIESAGAVVGGFLSALLLIGGMQNLETAVVCAVFAIAPLMVAAARERSDRSLRVCAFVFLIGSALLFAYASHLDEFTTRWNHPHVILTRDTPYGRVTVERNGMQIAVFENDVLNFETEGTSTEEVVHLALLAHPQPKRVLILGGAWEGMLPHVLQHDPERVDYVEINGRMFSAIRPLLSPEMQNSLADPRVHFIEGDPRRKLECVESYDVILTGISEPMSGQTNRFFTLEFFRTVAAHLNPKGVYAFRLRSAENYWSEPLTLRNASVVRALDQAFTHRLILSGSNHILLASNDSLPLQPKTWENRYHVRGIQARLINPLYIRYLFTNDRRAEMDAKLAAASVVANTDERPVCYHYAITIWLSKFYPALLKTGGFFSPSAKPWHLVAIVVFAVLTLIAIIRRWESRNLTLCVLVAVVGGCGMILETILLLRFQSASGILYQDIGLLLTLFMLGLSAGAGSIARIAAMIRKSYPRVDTVGITILAFFLLWIVIIAWRIGTGGMTGLMEVGVTLFLCGVAVAAIFGYAGLTSEKESSRIVGFLYGADLIGGCLGSVAASLILIPIAGLVWSVVLCASLCIISTIAVVH